MAMMDTTQAQEVKELERMLATERWFLSTGLVPETVQENLIAYGWLSSEKAMDVEVILDVNTKSVTYKVKLTKKDLKGYTKHRAGLIKYKGATSIFGKWMLLRLLRNNVKMDIEGNLRRFLKDYLPDFKLNVEVLAL